MRRIFEDKKSGHAPRKREFAMLGTVVNTAAVLVGAVLGLLVRGGLKEKYKIIVTQGVALAVFFVGASGAIGRMLEPESNAILFVVSMALGAFIGQAMGIEEALQKLGSSLQDKMKGKAGQSDISAGFVSASLLFCVGTMAILGPLESGLQGDHSILFAKSVIDGISALLIASTLGIGVLFAGASVFVYQGAITLLAVLVSPFVTEAMMRGLSTVGGVLICVLGTNMLGVTKIKVGNMLPCLLVPVMYEVIIGIFS